MVDEFLLVILHTVLTNKKMGNIATSLQILADNKVRDELWANPVIWCLYQGFYCTNFSEWFPPFWLEVYKLKKLWKWNLQLSCSWQWLKAKKQTSKPRASINLFVCSSTFLYCDSSTATFLLAPRLLFHDHQEPASTCAHWVLW